VRLGLRHALALHVPLLFVQPVDAGPPSPSVLDALLRAITDHAGAKPVVGNRGGHPVLLTAAGCASILTGSAPTLREALRELGGAGVARVPVEDPHVLDNWNRPDDLPPRPAR
jgi:CTP:molybdopterin cytidylyltransferase MocA